jgi:nucleoside-diphosphate-sugar epimerase
MRILVTGASGFLGTHITDRLGGLDGAEVITAGRSASGGEAGHIRLDLVADGPDRLAAALATVAPDVVVNCVGAVGGGLDHLAAINITGFGALLEALVRTARRPRLVHLGSAGEYGRVTPGVPVSERAAASPLSPYGVTKLAGTQLVRLARQAGLDAVVLRVFNPLGPGAPASSLPGRLVAEVARACAQDDAVRLGPLDAERDFVDARDVAAAVAAAVAAPALDHPVLNVGSGRAVAVRALVDELLAITGFAGEVREDAAGSARSADVPWMGADLTTTTAALGWRPRIDLTTSLTDMWKAGS